MIYLELFFTFFRIGLFTFGGGYAMLPLIQEAVLDHGWIPQQELVNFIAVSESTPGPFAVNMATFIGTRLAGISGATSATLGVVLPSFIVILIVAKCFDKFKDSGIVKGCMSGLKPATIGLIASAIVSVGKTVFFPVSVTTDVLFGIDFYVSLALFAVMTVLAFKKIHPIAIICISAVVGIVAGYII